TCRAYKDNYLRPSQSKAVEKNGLYRVLSVLCLVPDPGLRTLDYFRADLFAFDCGEAMEKDCAWVACGGHCVGIDLVRSKQSLALRLGRFFSHRKPDVGIHCVRA